MDLRNEAAFQLAKKLCYRDFPGGGWWRKLTRADMNDLLGVPREAERKSLLQANAKLVDTYHLQADASNVVNIRSIPPAIRKKYNLTNSVVASTNLIPIPEPMEPSMAASNVLFLYTASATGALLDELQAAHRQRPNCRFNLAYDYPSPPSILLPHLATLKSFALNYRARAVARLQLGQVAAAFEDAKMALYVGECLREEPFYISLLVRIACREIAIQPLWEGLAAHQWSAAQLAQFQAQLEDYDMAQATRHMLDGERAYSSQTIDAVKSGAVSWQELSGIGFEERHRTPLDFSSDDSTILVQLYTKGWLGQEQITYHRLHDSFVKQYLGFEGGIMAPAMIQGYEQAIEKHLAEPFWKVVLKHHLFAELRLPGLGLAAKRAATSQMANDLALIACALERYRLSQGDYPATLGALTPIFLKKVPQDVVNGKPLAYRKKADGTFLLYSVGWNEKNDDGLLVVRQSGNPILDEGDWVWQYTTPKTRMASGSNRTP